MSADDIEVPDDVAAWLREFFFDQVATMANETGDLATKMTHAGAMQAAADVCQRLGLLTPEELDNHMDEVRRLSWHGDEDMDV